MISLLRPWRLTRNQYGRAIYERLARSGVRFATLELHSRDHGGPSVLDRSLPSNVTIAVDRTGGTDLSDRPGALRDEDRVVRARADGSVVGRVFVSHARPVFVPPIEAPIVVDGAYLWRLAVSRPHRRRGIATALIARAVAAMSENGVTPAHALIAVDNVPSKRTFDAVGFESRGTIVYGRVGPWKRHRVRGCRSSIRIGEPAN